MRVRSVLRVVSVEDFGGTQKKIRFAANYDDKTPEAEKFQKYTPTASAEYLIDNPALDDVFVPGAIFYVDFTPVEAPKKPE